MNEGAGKLFGTVAFGVICAAIFYHLVLVMMFVFPVTCAEVVLRQYLFRNIFFGFLSSIGIFVLVVRSFQSYDVWRAVEAGLVMFVVGSWIYGVYCTMFTVIADPNTFYWPSFLQ